MNIPARLLALALLVLSPAPLIAACPLVDLTPGFDAFAARTGRLAPAARARAFVDGYVPSAAAYYVVPGLSPTPASLVAPAERYFAGSADRPGLRAADPAATAATARALVAELPGIEAQFTAALPAFRCVTPILVGISLDRFDGLTVSGGPGTRLLLGADLIARVHDAATRRILVQHELFHLYHRQRLPRQPATVPVWWGMWAEGLATYATERIDPARTPAQLIWFPRDVAARSEARRGEIARAMLPRIDATGAGYAAFFGADAGLSGLPPRAGYYMGYLLARELGRDASLDALARMPPREVRRAVAAFLRREAGAVPLPFGARGT